MIAVLSTTVRLYAEFRGRTDFTLTQWEMLSFYTGKMLLEKSLHHSHNLTAVWLNRGCQPASLLPPPPHRQPYNPLQGALGGREPSPWRSQHRSPTHRSIVTGVRWGEREQNVTATGFCVFLFLPLFSVGLYSDPCAQLHWRDCWSEGNKFIREMNREINCKY